MAKKTKEVITVKDYANSVYNTVLDTVEKDVGISSEEIHDVRLSTGTLAVDLIIGGGMRSGMISIVGKETGGKSTQVAETLGFSLRSKIPIIEYQDAEGSTSPDYLSRILKIKSLEDVFGKKINGEWVIPRRARYYDDNIIETTYDRIARTLNRIPDKIYNPELKQWFLVVDNSDKKLSQFNAKVLGDPNTKLSTKEKTYFPTENPYPQAFIAIDSYPGLLPEAVDENEEQSKAMAQQARAFSQNLPRVVGKLRRKHVLIMGTNQIREKPGVMFGPSEYEPCFVGGTTVITENGVDTIRNIVKKKKKIKVLSFNKNTGVVSYKKIIDWKENGLKTKEHLTTLEYLSYDQSGSKCSRFVTCTKTHEIWTPTGLVKAENLSENDTVFTNSTTLDYNKKQLIIGSILGDGDITVKGCRISILYNHVRYQRPYMVWKGTLLNNISESEAYSIVGGDSHRALKMRGKNGYFQSLPIFDTKLAKLAKWAKHKKRMFRSDHPKTQAAIYKLILMMELPALAIWYMDDGHLVADSKQGTGIHIACSRFNNKNKKLVAKVVAKLIGLEKNQVWVNQIRSDGCISITGKNNVDKFLNIIKPYMHLSMAYKVYEPNNIGTFDWTIKENSPALNKTKIISISKPNHKTVYVPVFDLTVEDNHTYFVGGEYHNNKAAKGNNLRTDGLAVSNCGNSLKFNSQVRLWYTPRAVPPEWRHDAKESKYSEEPSVEGKGTDKYAYKHVSNKKNKWGTPFLETWIRINISDYKGYGRGIDLVFDTFEFLNETGMCKRVQRKTIQFAKYDWPLSGKSVDWLEFKAMVLAEVNKKNKDLQDVVGKVYKKLKLNKPFYLREFAYAMMHGKTANEAMLTNKQAKLAEKKTKFDDDLED